MKFLKTKNYKLKTIRGFTLVEMLVATGIITVVMLVAIGSIITMQDANRKAQAIRAIIDNLHGAVENMSRKIRTGNTYHCGSVYFNFENFSAADCESSRDYWDTEFTFISSDDVDAGDNGTPTVYRMECTPNGGDSTLAIPEQSTGSCRSNQKGTIMYYNEKRFTKFEPLIDPKIDVKNLRFYVHNADGSRGNPSVLMTIKGTINIERVNISVPFNLQTTISQYIK